MRKLLVSIAAAGTLIAVAAPASAQWQHRQGQGYGYNGGPRAQLARDVQDVIMQREHLAQTGRLSGREARDLDNDIRNLRYSLDNVRGPMSPWQVRNMQNRIYQVRQEIRRYSDYDGRGRDNRGWHNGRRN